MSKPHAGGGTLQAGMRASAGQINRCERNREEMMFGLLRNIAGKKITFGDLTGESAKGLPTAGDLAEPHSDRRSPRTASLRELAASSRKAWISR